jgi:phage antirepressor YoqD-like protein
MATKAPAAAKQTSHPKVRFADPVLNTSSFFIGATHKLMMI